MPSRKTYYWDTCCFIAWMKDEERVEGELGGLHAVMTEIQNDKRVALLTSVTTKAEVLECTASEQVFDRFRAVLDRSNVAVINIDDAIAELAGEIRGYYTNPSVGFPDSLHLATAIHYDVTEFHTFDKKGRGNTRGLLTLDGNVAGYPLRIVRPGTDQTQMDLRPKE